jgi:competence protein ComEA
MIRSVFAQIVLAVLVSAVSAHAASQAQPAPASSRPAAASRAQKPPAGTIININTATAAELDALPGIGAKTAARIVEYRQKNGPFKKVEDLMNVRGVGEKNFLKLKAQISVGGAKTEHDPAKP